MATQTLTFATTATQLTKLTIPNASSLPRTCSVESIKLIGGNPTPSSSSSSQPLQRSSSASEMLALVNLANLQRLHIRASEPSSSSVASFDDDLDDLENPASSSSSSSSSSSDSEECETPDQVSPPFTRPTSPIGFVSEDEEEEWDLSNIKYTAGADLTPCFARGSAGAELRSSFSDSEDDEDDEGMVIQKKRSWAPGTPGIEKVEYHWNNTPSTSSASTPLAASEEEGGYFDDGDDDDDMVGSEVDSGEVWPDEMDSDDFPYLHSWPHSWIWTPPSATKNPTPHALPQIHFHYVESQISDQSSWTPLQDSRFGGCLTVPGHRVYNCPPVAPAARGRQLGSTTTLVPVQQVCEAAKVEYDEKLGRCAVTVPSLKEQQERGLYSTLSFSVLAASSATSSSSSSKRGRTRARSRVRGMSEDEDEDEDAEEGRGRSAARRSMGGCQFVLSAIRDADEDEDEEFVYDGASGQARAGRWD